MLRFSHPLSVTLATAAALSAAAALTPGAAQAQVIATYQFNNTLAAAQGGGVPSLTALNSGSFVTDTVFGQSRTVYQRTSASNASASQSALRLDTTALSLTANSYALELVFTFTDTLDPRGIGGYRRVVNSFDPANLQDPGFYVGPNSLLTIYQGGPNAGGPSLTDGTYYDVVLNVSPTGEQAFLNGNLVTSFAGTPDSIATHFLTFFQDEATEYGNGKVALIRVFNRPLTSGEVTTLNNNGNPFGVSTAPEPGAALLLLSGLPVGAGVFARRRRRRCLAK